MGGGGSGHSHSQPKILTLSHILPPSGTGDCCDQLHPRPLQFTCIIQMLSTLLLLSVKIHRRDFDLMFVIDVRSNDYPPELPSNSSQEFANDPRPSMETQLPVN